MQGKISLPLKGEELNSRELERIRKGDGNTPVPFPDSSLPSLRTYNPFARLMNSRTLLWSFFPGAASTPLETSTA